MKEVKEIDADTATFLTRNYFEKDTDVGAKSPVVSLSDWMCLTIANVEKHSKHYTVECELYEDPTANTKSKYRLKISKKGEIEEVSKKTKNQKKDSARSSSSFEFRKPREKTKH